MNGSNLLRDKYCYPNTDVLINNYDIRQEGELEDIERKITAIRIAELEQKNPQKSGYNLEKLCAVHQHIFGNLYDWAGKIRTVEMAKDKSIFCQANLIESTAKEIFERLKDDNYLQSLPRKHFVEKLANYMTDVNILHPFREGNGRTQRTFFKELSAAAGYELNFDKANKDIAITADIAAMNGNTEILKNMLYRIVSENNVIKSTSLSIKERIAAAATEAERRSSGRQPSFNKDIEK